MTDCVLHPSAVKQEKPEEEEDEDSLKQVLEKVLNQGLGRRSVENADRRKRGRPRKHPLPADPPCCLPLVEMLATPLERIEDIVDERIIHQSLQEAVSMFHEDDLAVLTEEVIDTPIETPSSVDVFHDVEAHSDPGSSSVYETASDLGSTSTSGTCDSRKHKWRRRKRPNMTGWPRSKKRKLPPINFCHSEASESEALSDDPITLSTIHEESSSKDSIMTAPVAGRSGCSPLRRSNDAYPLNKPFHFQRKSLKFVGKRILRPAAQRHAPQRLEYWPCFAAEPKRRRRRRRRKT